MLNDCALAVLGASKRRLCLHGNLIYAEKQRACVDALESRQTYEEGFTFSAKVARISVPSEAISA